MKKVLLSVGAVLAFGASAFAGDYGSAGCGLGSLAFKENDMTQILAATTNPQTPDHSEDSEDAMKDALYDQPQFFDGW